MKNLLKMLGNVFRAAPVHAVFGVLVMLVGAAEAVLTAAYLPNFLYDAIIGGLPLTEIAVTLLSIGAVMLTYSAGKCIYEDIVLPGLEARLYERMQKPVFDKSMQLDMQQYDDTDFYNDYRWASTEADRRAKEIYVSCMGFLYNIAQMGGFLAVILTMDPMVAAIGAAYCILSFVFNRRIAKINLAKAEELNQPKRRQEYIERVFAGPEYAKDLRMTDIGTPLLARLRENTQELLALHRKHGKNVLRVKNGLSACDAIFVDVAIYAYLAYALLIRGSITVGAFVSLAASAERILWRVRSIVNFITSCAEHAMFAKKYYSFLESEPKMENRGEAPDAAGDIVLENVGFTYPGGEKPILSDFSLTIRRGERVAIVGRNGAGKSTLIKLLLRLYDPDTGKVSYGGHDVREFEQTAYRQQFGVLFQDFHIFAATLSQNVAMDVQYDAARVEEALARAGVELDPEVFPQGLDTMISKEFGEEGTLLSGGQMQKVALARSLYARSRVLIFDEPSSALDPIAEYEFNRTLLERTAGHTLIIVAHRLSTVRMMDRIILIDGERIAEEGSHDELMAKGGLYAEMFDAQRRQYETDGIVE